MDHPCQQTYALRLRAPGPDPSPLAGVIEHVISGERQAFANGDELLRALQRLQGRAAAPPAEPSRPA